MNNLKIASSVTERIIMIIDYRNNYSAKIIKEIDATYAHGTKIFNILAKRKIITKRKIGRKIRIELTEKGIEIQGHLKEIRRLL